LGKRFNITEKEFYEKTLDASCENFQGEVWDYLGITKEQYREDIHCIYCKKFKKGNDYCEPYNPYCCSIKNYLDWSKIKCS